MPGAIQAFVGTNGGGKTLAAIEQCVLPAVDENRVIVGNLRLEVPDFRLLRSWRELIRVGVHVDTLTGAPAKFGPGGNRLLPHHDGYRDDLEDYSLTLNRPALVVLDEITACLPSRSYSSMPTQLQRVLNQLRKQDTTLVWTAPNWARCDVLLREVTQLVTVCRGYAPDLYYREPVRAFRPAPLRNEQGEKLRVQGAWKPRRLFQWKTYDAVDFEEFTADDQVRIRPVARRWYWRPAHVAQFVYETLESVQLLDHLDDLGICIGCNGKRKQRSCTCNFTLEADTPAPGAAGPGPVPTTTTTTRPRSSAWVTA